MPSSISNEKEITISKALPSSGEIPYFAQSS
jgi:hypothetical protein